MSAPTPSDFARILLERAAHDARTLRATIDDEPLDEAVFGFHAQQAVEKSAKAVLAVKGVPFPRTHDLVGLHHLAADKGIILPVSRERCENLNPFAVETRYGAIPSDDPNAPRLERAAITLEIDALMAWARREAGI